MSAYYVNSYDHEAGPLSYARHLASYISDPSKVRAHTVNNFGRGPGIDEIRRMIAEARKPVLSKGDICKLSDAYDGWDFRVRGLVTLKPEPVPERPRVVMQLAPTEDEPIVDPAGIIRAIADLYDLSYADIVTRSRFKHIVRARRAAIWVLVKRGNSMPQVARWVGLKDHTTVMHHRDVFEAQASAAERAALAKFWERAAEEAEAA